MQSQEFRRTRSAVRRARFVKACRNLLRDTEGAVAIEAIWSALILSVLLILSLFIFQIVKTGGSGPIDNRTAGRNAAVNESCSPQALLPGMMQSFGTRDDSRIVIDCDPSINGESRITENERFWPALIEEGENHFDDISRRQEGFGEISAVESRQVTTFTRRFQLGPNVLADGLSFSNRALTPMTDTWRFSDGVWAEGHDQVIWDRLTENQRSLFPRLYPSIDQPYESPDGDELHDLATGFDVAANSTEATALPSTLQPNSPTTSPPPQGPPGSGGNSGGSNGAEQSGSPSPAGGPDPVSGPDPAESTPSSRDPQGSGDRPDGTEPTGGTDPGSNAQTDADGGTADQSGTPPGGGQQQTAGSGPSAAESDSPETSALGGQPNGSSGGGGSAEDPCAAINAMPVMGDPNRLEAGFSNPDVFDEDSEIEFEPTITIADVEFAASRSATGTQNGSTIECLETRLLGGSADFQISLSEDSLGGIPLPAAEANLESSVYRRENFQFNEDNNLLVVDTVQVGTIDANFRTEIERDGVELEADVSGSVLSGSREICRVWGDAGSKLCFKADVSLLNAEANGELEIKFDNGHPRVEYDGVVSADVLAIELDVVSEVNVRDLPFGDTYATIFGEQSFHVSGGGRVGILGVQFGKSSGNGEIRTNGGGWFTGRARWNAGLSADTVNPSNQTLGTQVPESNEENHEIFAP